MTIEQNRPDNIIRWLLGNLRHARRWILLSVSAGFVGGLLLICQAALLSKVIQGAFIEGLPRDRLAPDFFMLGSLIALRAGMAWVRETAGFKAGAGVRRELRSTLMRHIGALGPVRTDSPHSGALSTVVIEQVEALQAFYALYIPQLALAVSIPSAILAFVFPISWAVGGMLLLTAPLIPLFMVLVGMGAENVSQKHFQALARMSGHFLDILQGLTTLKLLGNSRRQAAAIADVSDDYRVKTMKVLRVAFLSTAVLELFSSLSIALVAVYLGTSFLGYTRFGLYGEALSLKHGLFILLLAPDFFMPLRELGVHYHARAEAMGAASEILSLLSRRPDSAWSGKYRPAGSESVTVECRRICFAYQNRSRPVLSDVNLRLSPGEPLAIVGSSGAGKTTLMNLILGFIPPTQGAVLVNGRPLSDLEAASWHGMLAWLGQRPVLFHDTIAGNIRMALPQASLAEVEHAAQSAGVADFAHHLPEGLDTRIGEQGWGLSRGQAQRVALARVFLKNAPVLLLDEPTAGLDMDTAQKMMQAIAVFSKHRTVLWLTHRLEQLRTARRIAVLKEGRLVEQGSYAELVNRPGVFEQMVFENRPQPANDR